MEDEINIDTKKPINERLKCFLMNIPIWFLGIFFMVLTDTDALDFISWLAGLPSLLQVLIVSVVCSFILGFVFKIKLDIIWLFH